MKKKELKILFGIDLQTWDIYVPLGFVPNINIHKNMACHLKT